MPKNEKLTLLKQALILLASNAFIHISYSGYGPFLSAFYTRQGISVGQIGILLAVGPIITILFQPLWARISDRTGRRKLTLMVVTLGTSLSLLTYYLGRGFYGYLAATVLMNIFATSVGPLCDSLVVNTARKRGINFAHIRMGGTIGYSISVTIVGLVLDLHPNLLFAIGATFYSIMTLIVSRLPADRPSKSPSGGDTFQDDEEDLAAIPHEHRFLGTFRGKTILVILLFALAHQIGMSFYGSFLGVYLVGLGKENYIGIASSIGAISELPALLLINRMRRKFGTIPILFGCSMLLVARFFIVTQGSLAALFISAALQGTSYIPVYFCCVMFISESILPGRQSQGQSFLAVTQGGLASIIGNIGGGQLVEQIGLTSSYAVVATVILVICLFNLGMYHLFFRKSQKNIQLL